MQGISASQMAQEWDDYTPKEEKITFESGEMEIKIPITLIHDDFGQEQDNGLDNNNVMF